MTEFETWFAGLAALLVCKVIVDYLMEPSRYWEYTRHTWYSRWFCALGIHLRGRRGLSCTHDRSTCLYCDRDVLFVFTEEQRL